MNELMQDLERLTIVLRAPSLLLIEHLVCSVKDGRPRLLCLHLLALLHNDLIICWRCARRERRRLGRLVILEDLLCYHRQLSPLLPALADRVLHNPVRIGVNTTLVESRSLHHVFQTLELFDLVLDLLCPPLGEAAA